MGTNNEGWQMTESEWLISSESDLRQASHRLGPRRERLLAAAMCRALDRWVDYPVVWDALDAVETYANTGKTKAALRRSRQAIQALRAELSIGAYVDGSIDLALFVVQVAASENAVTSTITQAIQSLVIAEGVTEEIIQRRIYPIYNDIANVSSQSSLLIPSWRTTTAVSLAKQVYESRDYSLMPILADALQDAGCDNSDILDHCRGPGPHTRGCWALHLVLGKE